MSEAAIKSALMPFLARLRLTAVKGKPVWRIEKGKERISLFLYTTQDWDGYYTKCVSLLIPTTHRPSAQRHVWQ